MLAKYARIVGYAHNQKPYAGHVTEVFEATPGEVEELRSRIARHPDRYRDVYIVACGNHEVVVGDEVDIDERGFVRGP